MIAPTTHDKWLGLIIRQEYQLELTVNETDEQPLYYPLSLNLSVYW